MQARTILRLAIWGVVFAGLYMFNIYHNHKKVTVKQPVSTVSSKQAQAAK